NELAHLRSGWGVSAANDAPFALPADGGPIWFEDSILATIAVPFTFSFATGLLSTATPPGGLGYVFPVRTLDRGDLPKADHVIVEPHPSVVARFPSVTARGNLVAVAHTATITFFEASTRSYALSTGATFD